MSLLSVDKLTKAYGLDTLFKEISFAIDKEDKLALVGKNGTGKSSLLKILAGEIEADGGKIMAQKGLRLEYLAQEPRMVDGLTVMEQIFHDGSPETDQVRAYQEAVQALADWPEDVDLQRRQQEEVDKMERLGLWNLEEEIASVLMQLGIPRTQAKVETLSGGQKRRLALARMLIRPSDLLLLDEPTNHLDIKTINWLEKKISQKKTALLMVTHDRMFLDRTCQQIWELDAARLYGHEGPFSNYLEEKKARLTQTRRQAEKNQALYKSERDWMRAGVQGRGTRQKARVERFQALEKGMERPDDLTLDLDVPMARLGKKILDMDQVSFSYGDKKILDSFSYAFKKGDRIGIVGDNGSGKTSLLKLIKGALKADAGRMDWGPTVRLGQLSQMNEQLNPELSLLEVVSEKAYHAKDGQDKDLLAFQWLERFSFPRRMQTQKVGQLSGGERRRLALLRLLFQGPNVLLLDEPTNDLDLDTLLILEAFLVDYAGILVAVSHDRTFLNKTVHSIWEMKGQGRIDRYEGGYDDYERKKAAKDKARKEAHQAQALKKTRQTGLGPEQKGPQPLKMSYQDKKDLAYLEEAIPALEAKISQTREDMLKPGLSVDLLQERQAALETEEKRLADYYQSWTALAEKMEGCEG